MIRDYDVKVAMNNVLYALDVLVTAIDSARMGAPIDVESIVAIRKAVMKAHLIVNDDFLNGEK